MAATQSGAEIFAQAARAFEQGSVVTALEGFRAAERAGVRTPELYLYLGAALLQASDAGEAAAAFRKAHEAAPRSAMPLSNLSIALRRLGRLDEALDAARRAAELEPALLGARENYAATLLAAGHPREADELASQPLPEGSSSFKLRVTQALARTQLARFDDALAPAREALRLAPNSADAAAVAGVAALNACELREALQAFARARALMPHLARWRFREALAWPPIVQSREEILSRAAEVSRALDALVQSPGTLADPNEEVGLTGFYMAYQGFDDTSFQRRIAQAYANACPALEWSAPHVARPRDRARKIRIGIASAFLNDHTIGKLNLGFVEHLDRSRFEVVILRPPCAPDILSGLFDRAADAVVTLPTQLAAAREKVAEAQLDALFHPDVGMDPFMYFLAFARLARVQFTTWGHPVTTGIANMDYYLSTRWVEPPGAERFYTEKLVRFETLPSFYHRPPPASQRDMRERLGVSRETRLYACPQTLFKFHPDLDWALVSILRRDAAARVLLIESRHASWNRRLKERLQRAGPDVFARFLFAPPMSMPDFLALLRQADAVLDTFHFGGGSSSYEAFSLGVPVVTLPAPLMRGRITAGWYGAMGESRWIASSAPHFVELALQLAQDAGARRESSAVIEAGAARILENTAVVRELETFVEGALDAT